MLALAPEPLNAGRKSANCSCSTEMSRAGRACYIQAELLPTGAGAARGAPLGGVVCRTTYWRLDRRDLPLGCSRRWPAAGLPLAGIPTDTDTRPKAGSELADNFSGGDCRHGRS